MQRVETTELSADLVAAVYQAAADPAHWMEVVRRVTAWAGGLAGGLTHTSLWPEASASPLWTGLDPACERAYTEHYFRSDPWFNHSGLRDEGTTLSSQEMVPDDELLKSAFYNELCHPYGLRDLHVTIVLRDPWRTVSFATFRASGASGASGAPETKLRLQAISPHLTRAMRIASSLGERERLDSVLSATTQARRLGVVRVDAGLHVLAESEGAGAWLESEGGPITLANRRLAARDADDASALRAAVAAAIAGTASNVVLGKHAGDLVSVMVVPAPGGTPFSPEKSAHVLFSAPAEATRVRAMRDAFALTPAEARVAVKVARGQPLRTIAGDLGISYHTVRAHLRQCFTKTGARRQSALAALVHDSA